MPSPSSSETDDFTLSVGQAIVLGALHGPAELLPISSSGHVEVIPWLLGWDFQELDEQLRKTFEVALHAGTAAALSIVLRDELLDGLDRRRLGLLALSLAPPVVAGYALEREIERRLGTPRSVAIALLAGAVAMAIADRFPQRRHQRKAGARDMLILGVAQAAALIPGVSRNGATLAAARLLRFKRADAARLSREMGLPVIAGAAALKAVRLRSRGLRPGERSPVAAGAAASFVSTSLLAGAARQHERGHSLLPYVGYRVALAVVILRRPRR